MKTSQAKGDQASAAASSAAAYNAAASAAESAAAYNAADGSSSSAAEVQEGSEESSSHGTGLIITAQKFPTFTHFSHMSCTCTTVAYTGGMRFIAHKGRRTKFISKRWDVFVEGTPRDPRSSQEDGEPAEIPQSDFGHLTQRVDVTRPL